MRDPYEVLGVPRGAEAGQIKSAFRKLAKKHHPDANRNDPKTADKFAEVNGAYEILGDEAKRKQFDAGEIDAEGKPRFQGFEGAHPGGGFRAGAGGGPDMQFEIVHVRPAGRAALGRWRRLRRYRRHPEGNDGRPRAPRRRRPDLRAGGIRTARPAAMRQRPPPSRCPISPMAARDGSICRPARKSTSRSRPGCPTVSRSG